MTFCGFFFYNNILPHQHSTADINVREEYSFQLLSSTYDLERGTPSAAYRRFQL